MELWESLRVFLSKLGCGSGEKGEPVETEAEREVMH